MRTSCPTETLSISIDSSHSMIAARAVILREPGSAYVVERAVTPLITKGLLRRVEEAPVFERPAHVIYPSHPDVQAIALQGLREVAAAERGN